MSITPSWPLPTFGGMLEAFAPAETVLTIRSCGVTVRVEPAAPLICARSVPALFWTMLSVPPAPMTTRP